MSTFVYVGNAESHDISVLELARDGGVRPVHTVEAPRRPRPGSSLPLAVSPDRRFLFAAIRAAPTVVATYRVASTTGRLTYLACGSVPAEMVYITTDRTGRFLLSASYDANLVAVNPIADGIVGDTLHTVTDVPKAHSILPDPGNRFALCASLGGDAIHQHRFDATTGRLIRNDPPTSTVTPGAGPRHFAFAPDGTFFYVLNELDASLHVLPYDASTGTLKPAVQIASSLPDGFTGRPWAADVHLTPDGRFLYVSERTTSTLAAFRVDVTRGTLTRLGSYPTATQPRAFAIDPSGQFLLAVGERSTILVSYAIDQTTGELSRRGKAPVGRNPNWVEIVRVA